MGLLVSAAAGCEIAKAKETMLWLEDKKTNVSSFVFAQSISSKVSIYKVESFGDFCSALLGNSFEAVYEGKTVKIERASFSFGVVVSWPETLVRINETVAAFFKESGRLKFPPLFIFEVPYLSLSKELTPLFRQICSDVSKMVFLTRLESPSSRLAFEEAAVLTPPSQKKDLREVFSKSVATVERGSACESVTSLVSKNPFLEERLMIRVLLLSDRFQSALLDLVLH